MRKAFLAFPVALLIGSLNVSAAQAQRASAEDIAKALAPPAEAAPAPQERTRSMSTRNIKLDPVGQPGQALQKVATQRIDLDIEFEFGRAELTERGRRQLDALAQGMEIVRTRSLKAQVYQLIGHTDAAGGDESNLELSKRRAEAARDYLIATRGIRSEHVQVDWRGKRELKNAGDPYAAENRRVEVRRVGEATN